MKLPIEQTHIDFYPRSPRGERLPKPYSTIPVFIFLSTLPAWGATWGWEPPVALVALFLSTLPAWGATMPSIQNYSKIDISIHAPRVGSDGFLYLVSNAL